MSWELIVQLVMAAVTVGYALRSANTLRKRKCELDSQEKSLMSLAAFAFAMGSEQHDCPVCTARLQKRGAAVSKEMN